MKTKEYEIHCFVTRWLGTEAFSLAFTPQGLAPAAESRTVI